MQPQRDSELKNLMEEIREVVPEVTLKELRHPSSSFMIEYFSAVLDDFGKDTSEFPRELDDYDISGYLRQTVKLLYAVKAFFPDEVHLLDSMNIMTLLEPKPADIQYIIAMNNFHQFAANRCSETSASIKQKEKYAALENQDEILERHSHLKQLLLQHEDDHLMIENKTAKIIENIQKSNEIIHSLTSELTENQKILKDLEEEGPLLSREIKKIKGELELVQTQYRSLSGLIVQSPERFSLTKQELEQKGRKLREELEELFVKRLSSKKLLNDLNTANDLTPASIQTLESYLSADKEGEAVDNGISSMSKECELHRAEMVVVKKALKKSEKDLMNYTTQVIDPFKEKMNQLIRKEETFKLFIPDTSEKESCIAAHKDQLQAMEIKSREMLEEVKKKNQKIEDQMVALVKIHKEKLAEIEKKGYAELASLKVAVNATIERLKNL